MHRTRRLKGYGVWLNTAAQLLQQQMSVIRTIIPNGEQDTHQSLQILQIRLYAFSNAYEYNRRDIFKSAVVEYRTICHNILRVVVHCINLLMVLLTRVLHFYSNLLPINCHSSMNLSNGCSRQWSFFKFTEL